MPTICAGALWQIIALLAMTRTNWTKETLEATLKIPHPLSARRGKIGLKPMLCFMERCAE
jgi:hypothetical protein